MKSFSLQHETHVDELGGLVRLLEHDKTGARVMAVQNEDNNKVFCAAFPTISHDATGVAHILEHCALCGSPSFPVKDPFFELVKGSMNTFINAMTSRDRTYYPLASTNQADFCNQMRVYLDLVLNPLLRQETFEQEGWHFFVDENDKLQIGGVVFNEMKGAYSDPRDNLSEETMKVLFADTPYSKDSGGDPQEIPNLTYEHFKDFHTRHYHPSQSFILVYGNYDEAAVFSELENAFAPFDRSEAKIDIPLQKRFEAPKKAEARYAATEGEEAGCFVTVNWLLGERSDINDHYEWLLLDHILLMRPSSPLRKALIESGLGDGIAEWGYSDYLRESTFGTGLRGVSPEDCDKVEKLIISTLEQLAKDGISDEDIQASVNQFEFATRENNTGGTPQGLKLVGEVLKFWTYGQDPIAPLRYEAALTHLKKMVAEKPDFLVERIKNDFLTNPHRVTTTLRPDSKVATELKEFEEKFLEQAQSKMDEAAIASIRERKQQLEVFQNTPNTAEELASIPRLKKDEISPEAEVIESELLELPSKHLSTPARTNGLMYFSLGFEASSLTAEERLHLPLLCALMRESGTETQNYVEFDQRINSSLGGLGIEYFGVEKYRSEDLSLWVAVSGKSLVEKQSDLFELSNEILVNSKLSDKDRATQLIRRARSGLEQALVPSGHSFALRRAGSRFSRSEALGETLGGFEQLEFLRATEKQLESDWKAIPDKLYALREKILSGGMRLSSLSAEGEKLPELQSAASDFIKNLPQNSSNEESFISDELKETSDQYFTLPAQVHFCARALKLPRELVSEGSLRVVFKHLSLGFLRSVIREQGGAYGAFSRASDTGLVSFGSYRDPRLAETYDAFDAAGEHLSTVDLSEADIEKYIIGCMSDLSPHLLPAQKGRVSLMRYMSEISDERRTEIRKETLATTLDDFRKVGKALSEASDHANVCLGAPESAEAFKAKFPNAEIKQAV